jgi:uncharacterized protein (DUF1501 family)
LQAPIPSGAISRRRVLGGAGLAAVAWLARGSTALADVAVNPRQRESSQDVLVTVFLRGGADGLNLVVPYGDDGYGRNRPTIGIAAPGDRRKAQRSLDLDGFFGFHPALAPLHPFYKEGQLACVHACGSGDDTHSHFEAMATMERGLADERGGAASGWLARHLAAMPREGASPLRAIALGHTMPDALCGATEAIALNTVNDYRLKPPSSLPAERAAKLQSALAALYENGEDAVAQAGRDTLQVIAALNRLDPSQYKPARGAAYPDSDFGNGLRQVACLIKGGVGLEVACLDHRGPYLWDTHVAQESIFTAQTDDLGRSLAAFLQDMGTGMRRVTVIVMTEFGRRLQENSGLGTDHGRAGAMLLLGGGIRGGQVFGRWPGLADEQLEPPGDVRVTTDYRDVLAEIVSRRLHNQNLATVFPQHTPKYLNVTKV